MPRLGLPQQFRERRFLAQRLQPGIVGKRRETEESTGDGLLQQTHPGIDVVQMREMPDRIKEGLGIPEV